MPLRNLSENVMDCPWKGEGRAAMNLAFRNAPKPERWREIEEEARHASTLAEAMRLLEEADRLRRRHDGDGSWLTSTPRA